MTGNRNTPTLHLASRRPLWRGSLFRLPRTTRRMPFWCRQFLIDTHRMSADDLDIAIPMTGLATRLTYLIRHVDGSWTVGCLPVSNGGLPGLWCLDVQDYDAALIDGAWRKPSRSLRKDQAAELPEAENEPVRAEFATFANWLTRVSLAAATSAWQRDAQRAAVLLGVVFAVEKRLRSEDLRTEQVLLALAAPELARTVKTATPLLTTETVRTLAAWAATPHPKGSTT